MTMPEPDYFAAALAARPTLHTPRLVLRLPEERDIAAIIRIAGDIEVARRLSRMPHPYREEHARFFLAEVVPVELVWAIAERGSEDIVGIIGLNRHAPPADTIELGYYLDRAYWGRGLATEASAVVVAYAAGLVGLARLRSGYFADNPASGRVLAKLGFVPLGVAERANLTTGVAARSIEVGFPPMR